MRFYLVNKIVKHVINRPIFYLCLLGLLLFFIYAYFGLIITQTPGRMERASTLLIEDLSLWRFVTSFPFPLPQSPHQVAFVLGILSILSFVVYGLATYISWNCQNRYSTLLAVILFGVTFFLISLISLPNIDTDIYNYIMRGRVAAIYNENPYYVAADEFPHDPVYPFASHRYTKSPGGKLPTWMHINVLLAKVAGDDVVNNLLLYRFAFLLFNLANLTLIVLILYRLNPQYMAVGALFFSWNPIVVLFGQSKTDTVMAFFLLLGVWLFMNTRKWLAVISLGLSIWIKLITIPLVGIYLLRDIKLRRWRQLVTEVMLLFFVTLIIYIPFMEDLGLVFGQVGLMERAGSATPSLIRSILLAGFVALFLWVSVIQDGSMQRLLHAWAIMLVYFSLFVTNIAFAWYLITLVVVVALALDWRLLLLTIVICFSSFSVNIWNSFFTQNFPAPDLFKLPRIIIYIMLPLVASTLLGAFYAWQKIRRR